RRPQLAGDRPHPRERTARPPRARAVRRGATLRGGDIAVRRASRVYQRVDLARHRQAPRVPGVRARVPARVSTRRDHGRLRGRVRGVLLLPERPWRTWRTRPRGAPMHELGLTKEIVDVVVERAA